MGAWLFDLSLLALAVLLMGFAVYRLMFSAEEELRRDVSLRGRPSFDRREPERVDRRRANMPPPGGFERRVSNRR